MVHSQDGDSKQAWRRAVAPKTSALWEYITLKTLARIIQDMGGITGIPRRVLADHFLPLGGGIFVLVWLCWNCHGDTAVEIFLNHNANNIIHYNQVTFTWRDEMVSWLSPWPLKSSSGWPGNCTFS